MQKKKNNNNNNNLSPSLLAAILASGAIFKDNLMPFLTTR